jgi:hypothetical protein
VWAWPVSTNQPNAPSPSVKASASGANRRFDPSVIDALSNDVSGSFVAWNTVPLSAVVWWRQALYW